MFRIKRVKSGRTHYAAAVRPNGSVTSWAESPEQAVPVTDQVAQRVRELHAHRANVGELTFEPVKVAAADLAKAVAADAGVQAEEFARLQGEHKRLVAAHAELQGVAAERAIAVDAVERRERAAVQRTVELEQLLTSKAEEIAGLKVRVAELEKPRAEAPPAASDRLVLPQGGSSTAPPKAKK